MARIVEITESVNQSSRDIPLEKQIEIGMNHWVARLSDGREFFGESMDEAIDNALAVATS